MQYLSVLPKDPTGSPEYLFLTPDYMPGPASGNYYVIATKLENPTSQQINDFNNQFSVMTSKWPNCDDPLLNFNYLKGVY